MESLGERIVGVIGGLILLGAALGQLRWRWKIQDREKERRRYEKE